MLPFVSRLRTRYHRSFPRLARSIAFDIESGGRNIHHDQSASNHDYSRLQKRCLHDYNDPKYASDQAKDLLSTLRNDAVARRDSKAWNSLYKQFKDLQVHEGLDVIWKMFIDYPLDEVPVLYHLDMWKDLSGRRLIGYLHRLSNAGVRPPVGTLKKIGLEYHSLDILQLNDAERLEAAMEFIDVKLPRNVYGELIPRLCEKGDAMKALAWHRKLVANLDPPRDLSEVKRLRQLLVDRYQWAAALEVKNDVLPFDPNREDDEKITIAETNPEDKRRQALELFVKELKKIRGIDHAPTTLDDHTCARLFATKFFSTDFVIDGLSIFNVAQLGSLSMRELAKRSIQGQSCDSKLLRNHLRKLHGLGISCESRYGRLLEHLADLGKDALLYSIVTSDDHPDLFHKIAHQEQILKSSDDLVVERTREVLLFETNDNGIKARNMLLRAGHEDLQAMIAEGVPITKLSRQFMLQSIYVNKPPWISETNLRCMIRIFSRFSYVPSSEWRRLIKMFSYLTRPHLRKDLEGMLLSMKDLNIFDFRTNAGIIRWYLRLSVLSEDTGTDVMLGGVRVLARLRDQGLVSDIQRACEVNLVSLFSNAPMSEIIDRKKRTKAQKIGTFEDFVTAIREIYDPNMWHGMSPSEVKESALERAQALQQKKGRKQEVVIGRLPTSHTGAYNFGKTWHTQNLISEDDVAAEISHKDSV